MGNHKSIASAEELERLFFEYKDWVKQNPFKWHDFVGKDAEEVWKERERAITWSGFEAYLANKRILVHLGHYEQNKEGSYDEFLPIIRAIKRICTGDIIDGALSGIYNHNIAARLEGLADKKEVDKTVRKVKFTDAG